MLLMRSVGQSVFRTNLRRYAFPFPRFFHTHTDPSPFVTTDPSYTPISRPPLIDKTAIFHFAWLRSRLLIRLTGPDVLPFLQGLITANIAKFELPSAATRPIYTGFLNAQGRILNDVFLWRGHDSSESGEASWLIDVDAVSRGSLVAHLKKHKLRSKVKLENVSDEELRIYQGWVDEEYQPLEKQREEFDAEEAWHHEVGSSRMGSNPYPAWIVDKGVALSDPRPKMGMRWIGTAEGTAYDALRRTSAYSQSAYGESHLVSEDEYMVHRMLHGIAEGQKEIISGSALPQESNIDFFDGIDFRKGCYLGQELTIRTHHTGVVRKRILPVQLNKGYAPVLQGAKGPTFLDNPEHPRSLHGDLGLPPPGSNISKVSSRGRSTGKWLGGIGNIGLALCRLEMMTDIRLTEESTQYDPDQEFKISWDAQPGYEAGEVKVKAFVPQWLRDSLSASLKSRERKSTKDEEGDGVD
jgi:folate-binding protein YgfZ